MALVVLLRGVNVGGHKTFRPALLAEQLRHLDAVNIGAAGTLVIRKPIGKAQLRAELARRLPFEADSVICQGSEILKLMREEPFGDFCDQRGVVCFVSAPMGRPRLEPAVPLTLPPRGRWLVRIVGRHGRFVLGMYRRHMKTIGYLGKLDRLVGAPVTTRNWKTITAVARILHSVET